MKLRFLTGITAAALLIAITYLAPFWAMEIIIAIATLMACREYENLFLSETSAFMRTLLYFASLSCVAFFGHFFEGGFLLLIVSFLIFSSACVLRAAKGEGPAPAIQHLAFLTFGLVYLFNIFGWLIPITALHADGRHFLFLFFLVVFFGDTFAYLIGSTIGRTKLVPVLSPKKTVEGAIAGIGGSLVAYLLWHLFVIPETLKEAIPFTYWILFIPVVSVLGQLGDLLESLMKRSRALKDSGQFLPGHGGMLDRIDGLTLAAPAFYLFLRYTLGMGV